MNRENLIGSAVAGLTFMAFLYLFSNVLHWDSEYSWPRLLRSGIIFTVLYAFINWFLPKKQQNNQEK